VGTRSSRIDMAYDGLAVTHLLLTSPFKSQYTSETRNQRSTLADDSFPAKTARVRR